MGKLKQAEQELQRLKEEYESSIVSLREELNTTSRQLNEYELNLKNNLTTAEFNDYNSEELQRIVSELQAATKLQATAFEAERDAFQVTLNNINAEMEQLKSMQRHESKSQQERLQEANGRIIALNQCVLLISSLYFNHINREISELKQAIRQYQNDMYRKDRDLESAVRLFAYLSILYGLNIEQTHCRICWLRQPFKETG